MISSLLVLAYSYWAGQHYFTVSYEFGRLIKLVGATAVVTIVGQELDRAFAQWTPALLLYKLAIFALFIASLFVLRVVGQREIAALKSILSSIGRRNAAQTSDSIPQSEDAASSLVSRQECDTCTRPIN
jgi:hypothetical protein